MRRNGLSEELVKIEWDKKHAAKGRRREVDRLRQDLEDKDSELQNVRDNLALARQISSDSGVSLDAISSLNSKVQEQEEQISALEATLREKEAEAENDPNWAMEARDPFDFDDEVDIMSSYDQDFGDVTMADELMTTPTRLRTSFPSPPSTMPNTPSKLVSSSSIGTQASLSLPDTEKEALNSQLSSLQSEISKMTSTIALHEDNQSRLSEKLSEYIPTDISHDHSSLDSALDTVLTQLALSQSDALEKSTAYSALGNEIAELGFKPRSSPDEMIAAIAAQFRQARLDLEYINPGEAVEGFENEKLLGMLVSRLRVLNQRAKEGDDKIDQYHEQEVSLRQQLNTRIDAMQDVQNDVLLATAIIQEQKQEILDMDQSNGKLQKALQTYRDEVKGLEKLIERMDRERKQVEEKMKGEVNDVESNLQTEILRHDTTRADAEGKDVLITELEIRLNAALQACADVQKQMDVILSEKDSTIQQLEISGHAREKTHSTALALRDARVSELRGEIVGLNEALKAAYSNSTALDGEKRRLQDQLDTARAFGQVLLQDTLSRISQFLLETELGNVNDRNEVLRT